MCRIEQGVSQGVRANISGILINEVFEMVLSMEDRTSDIQKAVLKCAIQGCEKIELYQLEDDSEQFVCSQDIETYETVDEILLAVFCDNTVTLTLASEMEAMYKKYKQRKEIAIPPQ